MKLTQKSKFKGHSHLFKPHHYSHRNRHPQGAMDTLICSFGHYGPTIDQKVPKGDQNND